MAEKHRYYRPWLPVTVKADNSLPATNLEIRKCDCVAIQALHAGVATPEQQKTAFAAILHITGINDLEYLPAEHGGERDSAFKSGGRHIGLQLRKLVSFPLNLLTGEKNDRSEQPRSRRTGKPADDRNAGRSRQ